MVVFTIITGKIQRIRQTKKNGAVYIYDRTPYYDPSTKNTKYHYRYAGKEIGDEVKKVRSTLPKRSLIYGPFIPLLEIVRELGLQEMLQKHLTEQETNRIIALSLCKIVRPLPMDSIKTWYEGTYLSMEMPANLSSQRNSELMHKIGCSDLYRMFSRMLIERLHPGDSLLYDITSIPSYSSASIYEYGHAKDHAELEQINLSMVMEKDRKIPLHFELYPGSIPDVITLRRTVEYLRPMIETVSLILDRGFFSLDNLRLMKEMSYVIAASYARKEVKAAFSHAFRSVDRADNVIMYEDAPIFCERVAFRIEELELQGYFYHDPKREGEERADFHRKLSARRKQIEGLEIRKGLKKRIEVAAGPYLRYISYEIQDSRVITKAKDNAISAYENRMGRFLLVFRGEYPAMDCLSAYRQRDAIEKAFRVLKTDLDVFPLGDHKESTIRGTVFVFFLSAILRSALIRGMESTKLNEKYSVERMFLELEKLHMIEDQDGAFKELERTKRQKDILEPLSKISWW